VTNVDTIKVDTNGEFAIDLRNGQFAPGRTPEADGTSEIEVRGAFRRQGGVRVRGSSGADHLSIGITNGNRSINLDSTEAGPDQDVTVIGGFAVISVLGRGGNDTVVATGGPGFDGALQTPIAVSVGAGRDKVVGTGRRDLIGGGAGADVIRPRGGRDRVRSQGGADRLRLRDRVRDIASCGHGKDQVRADDVDKLSGCER
jgi:Ca2+-binding RTX toxin-like protein